MKKISYLPVAFVLLIAASCSMNSKSVKVSSKQPQTETALFVILKIRDTIKAGDPVLLNFTVYNRTDSVRKFLKWQTPFEPLMSKYLDIQNEQGEEVLYKGPMAKRMMPPPAGAYLSLNTKDSLSINIDILKGYALTNPGKYTISYSSENISGLKVRDRVMFIYK